MPKAQIDVGRSLPKKRNPLLDPAKIPEYSELVAKRRLGRTDLHVKPTQVGSTNATKPENLGTIEYAYLGAPLPENLKGSEIFASTSVKSPTPNEYFIMRRSKDGFISASGMFKVAFPWAKESEEASERKFLQTLSTTSADEQAGNIWINEYAALDLAEEYGINPWIWALLDQEVPTTEPHKQIGEAISPPPPFVFKSGGTNGVSSASPSLGPPASPARGNKKSKKADSPGKSASLSKATASPRKRLTKAEKEARAQGVQAAKAASNALQNDLDTAASVADSESVAGADLEGPKINGAGSPASPKPARKRSTSDKKKKDSSSAATSATPTPASPPPAASPAAAAAAASPSLLTGDDKVTVLVESTTETQGDIERTHTNVKVQMPADSPELPLPESTEEMIAEAKRMVEEARRLEKESNGAAVEPASASKKRSKRKADAIEEEEDELAVEAAAAKAEGRELQPAKRARLAEQQVRTQKVRSRALMGLAATLTLGAIAPYFLG